MNIYIKENLKLLRLARNLSQKELASLLSVSHKTVSHWESGYTEPSLEMVYKLKNLFQISYEELLEQ